MIKLRIKRNLMLMQQGCQSLSAKGSIMVHWMPLQRVKITEKEGIILDCTLHLESTLQQVIINGSCQSGCPNCSFFLRQKFEQQSLLQRSPPCICNLQKQITLMWKKWKIFEISHFSWFISCSSPSEESYITS